MSNKGIYLAKAKEERKGELEIINKKNLKTF